MAETKKSSRPLSANDAEIALLKSVFADNENLLKSIRSLFLGFTVNSDDANLIRVTFKDENLMKALRKKMYPVIDPTSDIGELTDFWLGTETEVLGKDVDTINQVVSSKQLALDMMAHAFELLREPTLNPIDLSFDVTGQNDPYQIRLLARNKYIKAVETGLTILKVIAGTKSETVEQAKKRMEMDSAK